MNNEIKIYVTYPNGEAINNWICEFLVHFKSTLDRIIEGKITLFVKEFDFNQQNYKPAIKESDVYIIILGTSSNDDEAYQQEIVDIYASLDIQNRNIKELSRLFKICLSTESHHKQIPDFHTIQSYKFFEVSRVRRTKVKQFSFYSDSIKSWAKLLDLVYDIKDTLPKKNRKTEKQERFVYLGSCSEDMAQSRDDIKRELQHFGARILPVTDLSFEYSKLAEVITENLENSILIVEVAGANYGDVPKGQKVSLYEFEHNCIRDYLDKNENINRIIWVPSDLRIRDKRQESFINRMKQQDSDNSTEILESSLEEFKTMLAQRLVSGRKTPEKKSSPGGIYVITTHEENLPQIKSAAKELNIPVLQNTETPEKSLYQNHLESLTHANSILIDYTGQNVNWLLSILKDTIKARGSGRKKPFSSIGVIADKLPDISDLKHWLPEIRLIRLNDKSSLTEFVETAKA